MDEIDYCRDRIKELTKELGEQRRTAAGMIIVLELYKDRNDLYVRLGRLVANSAVRLCLL